jgi:hypothetical protein
MKIPHSLNTIKKEIKRIESINTSVEPIEYLHGAIDTLIKGMWTPYFGRPENSGFELWRARSGKRDNVKDLWYPPAKYINNLGRMNERQEPVFYSCFGHNANLGSLEEIRAQKGDVVTQLCCNLEQQKPILKILSLGHADSWMEEKVGENFYQYFGQDRNQLRLDIGEEEFQKNEKIKNWMNSLFIKSVPEEQQHKYSHTIAISKAYFSGFKCDGILFPSVAADAKAINLVLRPEIADKYAKPISARVIEILDITDAGYVLKLKNESESIEENGNIIWKW